MTHYSSAPRPRSTLGPVLLFAAILCGVTAGVGTVLGADRPEAIWTSPVFAAATQGGESPMVPAQAPAAPAREFELLWSRYVPDPIYTTVGMSAATSTVFAGNYLNAPKQVEALPLIGDGTPDWVRAGNEFYVDAARSADVLAGIDVTPADSTITVMEWRAGSSTPLWTYEIHPCRTLTGEGWSSGKGIQVSDDGSTIAVIVNTYAPTGLDVRLVVFAAGSGTPLVDHQFPDGTASALGITADGAYIAIYAWPFIYVYDRDAQTLRWSGAAGSGNDALAISPDGEYIAWGWSTLNLRQWNGSTYQALWTTSLSGYYVTECALSATGRLALAWYKSTFDDTRVETYTLPAHALIWSYSYTEDPPDLQGVGGFARAHPSERRERSVAPEAQDPAPSGARTARTLPDAEIRAAGGDAFVAAWTPSVPSLLPTDVISELVWSPDGSHLAAGSWGPQFAEIHAWAADERIPAAIHDTPGTMFDIDVVSLSPSAAYVAACGKHVHAGTSGRGADLYLLSIGGTTDVDGPDEDASGAGWGANRPGSPGEVTVFPNPASGRVAIEWSAPGADTDSRAGDEVDLTIHDITGRLVRDLGPVATRAGRASWDGRDAGGREVPAGVYFVRVAAGSSGPAVRRLVIER